MVAALDSVLGTGDIVSINLTFTAFWLSIELRQCFLSGNLFTKPENCMNTKISIRLIAKVRGLCPALLAGINQLTSSLHSFR